MGRFFLIVFKEALVASTDLILLKFNSSSILHYTYSKHISNKGLAFDHEITLDIYVCLVPD